MVEIDGPIFEQGSDILEVAFPTVDSVGIIVVLLRCSIYDGLGLWHDFIRIRAGLPNK